MGGYWFEGGEEVGGVVSDSIMRPDEGRGDAVAPCVEGEEREGIM